MLKLVGIALPGAGSLSGGPHHDERHLAKAFSHRRHRRQRRRLSGERVHLVRAQHDRNADGIEARFRFLE